jgi:peptidoglycan biosynthesis protein MviN/MurJ (putative lipid II flippase)
MVPPLIDQLYAHVSGARFLTVFNYAIKIPNIMTTISMIIASSVLLPFFLENKDKIQAKLPDRKKLFGTAALLVLFYLLIPFLSPIIVKIIYERGKFSAADSFDVSMIQTYYFFSAPLTAGFMVYIRYLNAHEKNFRATWLASGVTVCSLIFGYYWTETGRFEYIPFSIIGSYIITISTFLIWKKFRSNDR